MLFVVAVACVGGAFAVLAVKAASEAVWPIAYLFLFLAVALPVLGIGALLVDVLEEVTRNQTPNKE